LDSQQEAIQKTLEHPQKGSCSTHKKNIGSNWSI